MAGGIKICQLQTEYALLGIVTNWQAWCFLIVQDRTDLSEWVYFGCLKKPRRILPRKHLYDSACVPSSVMRLLAEAMLHLLHDLLFRESVGTTTEHSFCSTLCCHLKAVYRPCGVRPSQSSYRAFAKRIAPRTGSCPVVRGDQLRSP